MSAAAIWAVVGLVLAGLEMLAPGFFLLWIGVGALGTAGVVALLGLGWHGQLGSFAVLTVALVGVAAVRLRRVRRVDLVNGPAAGLIGQTCRAVTFEGGEGRVALGDGMWPARVEAGAEPVAGASLTVVGLEGTTLLVAAKG